MTPEAEHPLLSLLFVLVGWGTLFSWLLVTDRWRRGVPLTPYSPRRHVPWNGAAVALLLCVFVVCQILGVGLAHHWFGGAEANDSAAAVASAATQGDDAADAPPNATDDTTNQEATNDTTHDSGAAAHPLVRFLASQRGSLWAIWLAAAVGVVVAPLVEELLFRVLLQGWLEARESRWRRRWPLLRALPRGVLPIALPALVFASMHFRSGPPPSDVESLGPVLLGNALGSLAALSVAALVLCGQYGAKWHDLGLNLRPWPADAIRGLVAFAAVLMPIYVVQLALAKLLAGWEIAADPAPLLLLAVVLGYLYYRTHRLTPSLVLHVAINLFGLAATWLTTQAGPPMP